MQPVNFHVLTVSRFVCVIFNNFSLHSFICTSTSLSNRVIPPLFLYFHICLFYFIRKIFADFLFFLSEKNYFAHFLTVSIFFLVIYFSEPIYSTFVIKQPLYPRTPWDDHNNYLALSPLLFATHTHCQLIVWQQL